MILKKIMKEINERKSNEMKMKMTKENDNDNNERK